jgi:hypothetical protein
LMAAANAAPDPMIARSWVVMGGLGPGYDLQAT